MAMFKKIFRKIVLVIFVFSLMAQPASAFWIWTPKTQKWVNPKWTVKNTPGEQMAFAKEIFDKGDYKAAMKEFRQLINHYKESLEAADAQFYVGACLEKLNKPYEAYLAYQKVFDKYAFSDKLNAILEREFYIAQSLVDSVKKEGLSLNFLNIEYAITIYRKITENWPHHDLAAQSQYRIGMVLKDLGRLDEARQEFDKVVSQYPESKWFEAAKFQLALCASSSSLKPDYDQALTKEAQGKFEDFVTKHPDSDLVSDTENKINTLSDKQAEKDFNVGKFYEKQKSYKGAILYYRDVIKKYPHSTWAQQAEEKIKELEEAGI